jgi:hypothetical protein
MVSSGQTHLTITATDAGVKYHPIAHLDRASKGAQRDDLANDLLTQREWVRYPQKRQSSPHPEINIVHGTRSDPNEDLVSFKHRLRQLTINKLVEAPMLVDVDRFHVE